MALALKRTCLARLWVAVLVQRAARQLAVLWGRQLVLLPRGLSASWPLMVLNAQPWGPQRQQGPWRQVVAHRYFQPQQVEMRYPA